MKSIIVSVSCGCNRTFYLWTPERGTVVTQCVCWGMSVAFIKSDLNDNRDRSSSSFECLLTGGPICTVCVTTLLMRCLQHKYVGHSYLNVSGVHQQAIVVVMLITRTHLFSATGLRFKHKTGYTLQNLLSPHRAQQLCPREALCCSDRGDLD